MIIALAMIMAGAFCVDSNAGKKKSKEKNLKRKQC